MRLFWEMVKRSFQRHLTYRAAAIAGLITNFFFGWLRISVLVALYGQRQVVEGMTVPGIYTYVGLTQAVLAYLSLFGWYELADSVYTGEVGTDLLKPLNYFTFWLARDLGRALVGFLLRGVTIMLLYDLIFEMAHPTNLMQWAAVVIAVLLSWLVSFAWRFLINLAAFWTPNARGIGRFGFVLTWFFSGFLMPLRFYPGWVQTIARLTPFPHMLNTVVEVYLGVLPGPALWQALLNQLLWTIGLIFIGHLVLRTAVRRLVILGG
jgi:ABC-2 type transport system permease protein